MMGMHRCFLCQSFTTKMIVATWNDQGELEKAKDREIWRCEKCDMLISVSLVKRKRIKEEVPPPT
jgi:hypothetical protein